MQCLILTNSNQTNPHTYFNQGFCNMPHQAGSTNICLHMVKKCMPMDCTTDRPRATVITVLMRSLQEHFTTPRHTLVWCGCKASCHECSNPAVFYIQNRIPLKSATFQVFQQMWSLSDKELHMYCHIYKDLFTEMQQIIQLWWIKLLI